MGSAQVVGFWCFIVFFMWSSGDLVGVLRKGGELEPAVSPQEVPPWNM